MNGVRHKLSYRFMQERRHHPVHCHQCLHLCKLLEHGRNADTAATMREHLGFPSSLLAKISTQLGRA